MNVSYVRDKVYITQIFDFYKIKYKLAVSDQKTLSIYSEGDQKICSLPIDTKTKRLRFLIFGQRINRLDDEEQHP